MTNSFNLSYDRAHPSGWWRMECGTLFGMRGTETSLCEEPSQTWLLIQINSSSYKMCRYSALNHNESGNFLLVVMCLWNWPAIVNWQTVDTGQVIAISEENDVKIICWLQIIPAYCVFGKMAFVWHFQFQLQRQSHEGRSSCVQTCWNASTISWQGIHIISIHLCNNCSLSNFICTLTLMIWTTCLFQRLQKASLNRKSNSSVSTECTLS